MSASDARQANIPDGSSSPVQSATTQRERRMLLATCVAAVARSAEVIRDGAGRRASLTWESKSEFDFVSDVDRASEAVLAEIKAKAKAKSKE